MLRSLGRTSAMLCALAWISTSERADIDLGEERVIPEGMKATSGVKKMEQEQARHYRKVDAKREPMTDMLVKELHTKVPKLDGKDDDPQIQEVYNTWFSPSGRELSPNGSYLSSVLYNVKEQAHRMERRAKKVLQKADAREVGSGYLKDALSEQEYVAKGIERKQLQDFLQVDRDRMKWVNQMLDVDHKGLPTRDNLLDYVEALESLDEAHPNKQAMRERAQGKRRLYEAENEKAPFKDLLFPHQAIVSRRAYGAVGSYGRHFSQGDKLSTKFRQDSRQTQQSRMASREEVKHASISGTGHSRAADDEKLAKLRKEQATSRSI